MGDGELHLVLNSELRRVSNQAASEEQDSGDLQKIYLDLWVVRGEVVVRNECVPVGPVELEQWK